MTDRLIDPARGQALRAARAAALARRGIATERAGATQPFLVCLCGTERYGLHLGTVAAVLPGRSCTPVPGAPPALLGIVALSGRIVSVLGLARAMGAGDADAEARPSYLVTLRAQEPPIALGVDRVIGVVQAAVPSTPAGEPAARPDPSTAGPNPGSLGIDAVSGYAPPDPDRAEGAREGFVIVDLPLLLRRFLP